MLQITVDPTFLSRVQREALADFILSYPNPDAQEDDDDELAEIPAFATEDEEADPAAVFAVDPISAPATEAVSDPDPAAVFAVAPIPAPPAGIALVPTPPADDRLDKGGIPWDERIHASSRAKTADGSWRKKRGIDDATVAQVESELKALMALPGAGQPAAIPAPPAVPAPPVPATVVEDRQAYVTLLSVASAAINAKTLTAEQLNEAVAAVGVTSLPLLGNRLDLVPQVMASVKAIIG